MLGVELRAAYHLARAHLERGDLADGGGRGARGHQAGQPDRARPARRTAPTCSTCTSSATTPTASGTTRRRSRTASRSGSPAFPRPRCPRWRCSSTSRAATRWSRSGTPGSSRSCRPTGSTEFIARGLIAEHALWQGDVEEALAETRAALTSATSHPGASSLGHQAGRGRDVRPGRPGGAGQGDRRRRGRGRGGHRGERAAADRPGGGGVPQAAQVHPRARGPGLAGPGRGGVPPGHGDNDPQAWQAVLDAFGPGYVYEIARDPVAAGRGAGRGGPPGRGGGAVARRRCRPRTGSPPGRCAGRSTTWPAGPGSATARGARRR